MLSIIVDALILILIVVKAIFGMSRGFFRSLVRFFGYFIQIILAVFLYEPLANWMDTKFYLKSRIAETVKTWFNTVVSGGASDIVTKGSGIPKGLESITKPVLDSVDPLSAVNARAMAISDLLVNMLSFIVILMIVGIILSVVATILDKACSVPILKQVNGIAALGLGALDGYFVVCVLLVFVSIVVSRNDASWLIGAIDNSVLGSFIQQNNPITYIIGKFIIK